MIGRSRPFSREMVVVAAIALLTLSSLFAAQKTPKPNDPKAPAKPPAEEPAPAVKRDNSAAPLAAGKRALAEGKKAEAVHHLEKALESAPDSAEILALLADASSDDRDARTLWLHAFATAALAPNGTVELSPEAKKRLSDEEPRLLPLAAARIAAVEELLKFAGDKEREGAQRVDALLVAQWARRFALDLVSQSPLAQKAHESELSPRLTLPESLPGKVVKSLEAYASNVLGGGKAAESIKAARILSGLGQQLKFGKDLQGPAPSGVGDLKSAAASVLARARQQLGTKSDKPWTIDELLQLDGDQAEAFTRAHSSFADPGIGVSPQSWYRIETDCGFQTLLGTAQTIELHHKRLANWYGQDPFVGRPGLCRVVPEAAGMEAEGEPFWWAGGFQSADVTTVRFCCGTIEGLGHLLTHELTHRFDGAIYPGIPAWLMEGKAVWTGGAYGSSSDDHFVEHFASLGQIEGAFIKGYGDPNKLLKLIEGTIDDYRDNYVAGYALYVYLTTRKNAAGHVLFNSRMQKFQTEARGVKKWEEHFVKCFCDGKEERPKDFKAFVADWSPWLAGFYWQVRDKNPWTKEYTEDASGGKPPVGDGPELVMDEPTWVWTRARAEPRFGQEQAALAGNLLLDGGKRQDAIPALTWALAIDGRRPAEESRLALALEAENHRDSAWVVKNLVEFPFGARVGASPFASSLQKTTAFVEQLDAAVSDASLKGLNVAAAALRADRERVATWLGLDRSPELPTAADPSKLLHPFDTQSRLLATGPAGSWIEKGLTGYEERRVKGRWYVDEDGHLHVGRDKPRAATGTVDRGAAQVDCFALAPEWILPGSWRLDVRIRFETSFVAGAIVFGYSEREENLRFGFNAGDFLYATGVSNKEPEFTSVGWGIDGLRERDGGLPGSTTGAGFPFGQRQSSFEVSLVVDGSLVNAYIDGKWLGCYHTADGAAIEGQIGFATGMGSVGIENARVTRLERSRLAPSATFPPTSLDLASARSLAPWDSLNRRCVGLARAPQGTLLFWLAPPDKPLTTDVERAGLVSRIQFDLRELASFVERVRPTQKLVVAIPAAVDDSGRKFLDEYAKRVLGSATELAVHPHTCVPEEGGNMLNRRWLLFVDSASIVRARSELPTAALLAQDRNGFLRWLDVFREHGHPPRDLPPVERPKPAPKEDDSGQKPKSKQPAAGGGG
jgi:tetratricopeptide (TPR) repeat protein